MNGEPIDPTIRRVLVTGAAGFIGRSVTQHLVDVGIEPLRLDRVECDPRPDSVSVTLDLVTADLHELLGEVDAVIHLAGTPGVQSSWAEGFEVHVRDNLLATQRLCEAALATDCRRVVVASSSSVYGDVVDGGALEDGPLAPLSPYGASKAAVEHLLHAYEARGLSVAAMRYFTVYGPWQRPDMAIHRLFRAALGGPAFPLRGSGEQRRSFTFVDDVADATVRAVRRQTPHSVFNIGGGEVISVRDLIDRIEHLTGRSIAIEQLPPSPGDPRRTAADVSRARAELGWNATTSIDDGLRAQWAWHEGQRQHRPASAAVGVALG